MRIKVHTFRVGSGKKGKLGACPTKVTPCYTSKTHYHKRLVEPSEKMSGRQSLLYGHDRYALLVIFQARGAADQEGDIKHVMSGLNPHGCQVLRFKQPSASGKRKSLFGKPLAS